MGLEDDSKWWSRFGFAVGKEELDENNDEKSSMKEERGIKMESEQSMADLRNTYGWESSKYFHETHLGTQSFMCVGVI